MGVFFFVLNVSVVVRLIIKWVSRYEIPTGTGIAGLKQVVAPNYSTFHKLDCSSLLAHLNISKEKKTMHLNNDNDNNNNNNNT